MEVINIGSKIVDYRLTEAHTPPEMGAETVIPTDIKLPDDSPARLKVLRAEGKKWYLFVTSHEETNQPFALFCLTNHPEKGAPISDAIGRLAEMGRKKGILDKHVDGTIQKCNNDNNVTKLTRVISLLLRHGISIKNIVRCLDKMEDVYVGSFLFQLKKFFSQYIKNGEIVEDNSCIAIDEIGEECGGQLVFHEGCLMCTSCGASKCQ